MPHLRNDPTCTAVEAHVRRHLSGGRPVGEDVWDRGPLRVRSANAHFRVLRMTPAAPDGAWVYASVGGWAAREDDVRLEFVLCAPFATRRAVELLAMIVHYGRGTPLGLGHTVPIGEPWLPGSQCDHLLLSTPYPFDPSLGSCDAPGGGVDVLWLLPITAAERDHKVEHGLDPLEDRFEEVGIRYWDPARPSVV